MPDSTTDTEAGAVEKAPTGKAAPKKIEPAPDAKKSSAPTSDDAMTPAQWLERSSWFTGSQRRHALAGALHDADPDEELSQAEVQRRLDEFRGR